MRLIVANREMERLSVRDALSTARRALVLGDPGTHRVHRGVRWSSGADVDNIRRVAEWDLQADGTRGSSL
ncbi:MAG: hypothetical protein M0Z66_13065 [Thermaerobacter sp.]|nr:hypothetical protein [Thermaerobacter sp.]